MSTEVILPKWGLTMEDATVLAWHVAEGDSVREGEVIAEKIRLAIGRDMIQAGEHVLTTTASLGMTGIKPTGSPTLGNYLGMIRPALALVERFDPGTAGFEGECPAGAQIVQLTWEGGVSGPGNGCQSDRDRNESRALLPGDGVGARRDPGRAGACFGGRRRHPWPRR